MRPTDTTPAFTYKSQPANGSKLRPACQEQEAKPRLSFSNAILLLNFEPSYRERLAFVLRFPGLKVISPEEQGISLVELRDDDLRQADFILFDLTHLNHDHVWMPLRHICRLRKHDGMPLLVHCFSRIDRGSDFHLMVEKLGARMDYYGE